jgi:hypothetical protein
MKRLINLCSLVLIFLAPVYYVIVTYSVTEETPPETTVGMMGFALIAGMSIVALAFIKNLIHSHLQKEPLGSVAVIFYGLIMIAVFGLLLYGSHYIVKEASFRLSTLVETFEGYRETATWLIAFVGSGIALQAGVLWINFKQK